MSNKAVREDKWSFSFDHWPTADDISNLISREDIPGDAEIIIRRGGSRRDRQSTSLVTFYLQVELEAVEANELVPEEEPVPCYYVNCIRGKGHLGDHSDGLEVWA